MRKSIIVAVAENGVIGAGNKLPWRLPEDLRRFKALTLGHCLIMGRKTYDSIGKPLPGRMTLVLSRRRMEYPESVIACGSLSEAFERAQQQLVEQRRGDEVFICGGGEVYREALPFCDRIYLTAIGQPFDGDITFAFDSREWRQTAAQRSLELCPQLPFVFETWDRIR